jgi:hypothetical protein
MAKRKQPDKTAADRLLDAVAEIVHQGYGRLLDGGELRATLDGWKPNCCMNFEYVFAWNPDLDIDALQINWKRPNRQILRRVVKRSARMEKIRNGSPMTKKEQHAYRLELARRKHGYKSAEECLDSGTDCKWVDLSFITDSKGRDVYVLEIGDALSSEDEDIDSIIERHEEIWQWKSQLITIVGPFTSSDEAEEWMAESGVFEEVD